MARVLEVRLHDTSIGIWQDNANDPSFRREIFLPLVKLLRGRGWTVAPDPMTLKNYRIISPDCKLARKGEMRGNIQVAGRNCSIEFWSEAARNDNNNGPRYDFDKLDRMPYLDRQRFLLARRKILDWLASVAVVTRASSVTRKSHPIAAEFIAAKYSESWHTDKAIGRPVCNQARNAASADGCRIEHGCVVWFRGRDGRWRRGQAFYNINNMWWVTENRFTLHNLTSLNLYRYQPSSLREKRNDKARRAALERELKKALQASDYSRAEIINRVLFGDQAPHFIWSRKRSAYYRTNYCGYATSPLDAGRYSRAEAEAECRRAPHILEMVCPNGKIVRFDTTDTAEEKTALGMA